MGQTLGDHLKYSRRYRLMKHFFQAVLGMTGLDWSTAASEGTHLCHLGTAVTIENSEGGAGCESVPRYYGSGGDRKYSKVSFRAKRPTSYPWSGLHAIARRRYRQTQSVVFKFFDYFLRCHMYLHSARAYLSSIGLFEGN